MVDGACMKLDTTTILFISILVDFTLVLILIHTWRTRTTYSGFGYWTIGTACWSVGSMLTLLFFSMHPQFLPKILGNTLIMMHPLLLYVGIQRFYSIPTRWWGTPLNFLLVLAFLVNQLYFFYVSDNMVARIVVISLVLSILFMRIALEPLLYTRARSSFVQWLLSFTLLPLIILLALRGWFFYTSATAPGTVQIDLNQEPLLRLLMFYGIFVEIIIAYSYLSLTSDRVEEELKKSEEDYSELTLSLQSQIEKETRLRLGQERLLANQSRLAAMGEMISAIAHQWRQPLSTLGMIVQRLHAQASLQRLTNTAMDEFKASAMRQIHYMSDTIEEFRGFYRPEKKKEPFSPFTCIADSVRLFDCQFTSNNIALNVSCQDGEDHLVNGLPNEFKQVILNVLGNARDAILESRNTKGIPEGGIIEVRISIGCGSTMTIDISDNGCGIPLDVAPKIFNPYFTTKEENGGTGIGLYMSRMIVEDSLDGQLDLIQGLPTAIFRIELPLVTLT